MSASAEVISAFFAWAAGELAAHHAEGAEDEAMNTLVDHVHGHLKALSAVPATSPADIVLKLFPSFLSEHEPQRGDPPLRPRLGDAASYAAKVAFDFLIADMIRFCPEIGAVMSLPHRSQQDMAA